MHYAVQLVGVLLIIVGVVSTLFGGFLAWNAQTWDGSFFLRAGFGTVVSGVLFWGVGAIVEHLVAIRRALEKQP